MLPAILSLHCLTPPYRVKQDEVSRTVEALFSADYPDLERYLKVFDNDHIKQRYFSVPLDWFKTERSFKEKNDLYLSQAVKLGIEAITNCLNEPRFLNRHVNYEEIDAIIFVSSSGLATPTVEARIMNKLPFSRFTARLPVWGLGCAGGAAGLARAYDYCLAHPEKSVLLLCVELCSLTFQWRDRSKSNLIGTSLFGDGVAALLLVGDRSPLLKRAVHPVLPWVTGAQSALWPQTEEVMGWEFKDDGFYVVFAKSIPRLVKEWLRPTLERLLHRYSLNVDDCHYLIAHPGGEKVLDAYAKALDLPSEKMDPARRVLRNFGNMSSVTVLFVLNEVLNTAPRQGEVGLVSSLGPGLSSELVLLKWEAEGEG